MSKRTKIDLAKCYVEWLDIDYGIMLYICRSREHAAPVGLVWGLRCGVGGKAGKKASRVTFDVYGSFVPVFARRQGVRSKINDTILEHHNAIRSAGSSPEGLAFMRKAGYHADPVCGWVLERPAKKRRRA